MYYKMLQLIKTKKGDLELDELGKVILGLVLLLILIIIIMIIKGEFSNQEGVLKGMFNIFK